MKKREKTEDQGILRVSIEKGAIRVRMLTAKEEKQFYRTHPNFRSQNLSVEDIERLAKTVPITEPGTINVANAL